MLNPIFRRSGRNKLRSTEWTWEAEPQICEPLIETTTFTSDANDRRGSPSLSILRYICESDKWSLRTNRPKGNVLFSTLEFNFQLSSIGNHTRWKFGWSTVFNEKTRRQNLGQICKVPRLRGRSVSSESRFRRGVRADIEVVRQPLKRNFWLIGKEIAWAADDCNGQWRLCPGFDNFDFSVKLYESSTRVSQFSIRFTHRVRL